MRFSIFIGIMGILGLLALGCSDDNSGNEGDAEHDNDSDSQEGEDSDTTPPACDDGVWNGNELGVDCGGSCDNQDCCTNGVTDANLGEWSADCGGACGSCFSGTVHFVANDGSDENDGLSEGADGAWQTIAHVNSQSFSPGDAVLFKRGDVWREELIIGSSGTADAYITFGAYGEGEKPQILGSERAENWTAVSGAANIWQSATPLAAPREREGNSTTNHPSSIFFGELDGGVTWGNMEALHQNSEGAPIDIYQCDEEGAQFSLLDEEYDWCWQEKRIYVYAPGNPGIRYAFVEVPQRSDTIRTNTHPPEEYIAIDGLELLFAFKYGYDDGWPMNVVVRGLNVSNCHIGYMGTKGAASAMGLQIWHSDMLVQNNDIHDCGRRSISYNVYGDVREESLVFENVIFDGNTLHNGYHTTGFDISAGYTDTFRNFVFSNNFLWDRPDDNPQDHPNDFTSMGFFLNSADGVFTDFSVHRNVLKYTKQKGIVLDGLVDSVVANNTFYDMNELAGGEYRGMITVSGEPSNTRIVNNLFYGSVPSSQLVLSCVTFSGSANDGIEMDYNLYYQAESDQRIVTFDALGSYTMDEWTQYQADSGYDRNSPVPAEPLLTEPENDDFTPSVDSPAVDAGTEIAGITDGYSGTAPDIGAVEAEIK